MFERFERDAEAGLADDVQRQAVEPLTELDGSLAVGLRRLVGFGSRVVRPGPSVARRVRIEEVDPEFAELYMRYVGCGTERGEGRRTL